MRILTTAIILATAASTAAFATEGRLSDASYLKAAQCRGLMGDSEGAARLDAVLKANAHGRATFIIERADNQRRESQRSLRKAVKSGNMEPIERQLSGACAAYSS